MNNILRMLIRRCSNNLQIKFVRPCDICTWHECEAIFNQIIDVLWHNVIYGLINSHSRDLASKSCASVFATASNKISLTELSQCFFHLRYLPKPHLSRCSLYLIRHTVRFPQLLRLSRNKFFDSGKVQRNLYLESKSSHVFHR